MIKRLLRWWQLRHWRRIESHLHPEIVRPSGATVLVGERGPEWLIFPDGDDDVGALN